MACDVAVQEDPHACMVGVWAVVVFPPDLELLGYEDTLRWVSPRDRDAAHVADPDTNVQPGVWPPAKVHFRTVDDFDGREEWEWLLRYRSLPDRCYRCEYSAGSSNVQVVALGLTSMSLLRF